MKYYALNAKYIYLANSETNLSTYNSSRENSRIQITRNWEDVDFGEISGG